MSQRSHHRPLQPGDGFFADVAGGTDPAALREAADRAAELLVRGARTSDDAAVSERLRTLAEAEGLETLAELWAGAPAESLAGCVWRLYVLRTWVYADAAGAARQFDAGRSAQVARVVAGVAEPPTPDQLRVMVDDVLRGIAEREFADVLLQAAAFARVIATGRAHRGEADPGPMLTLAEHLERSGHLELAGELA